MAAVWIFSWHNMGHSHPAQKPSAESPEALTLSPKDVQDRSVYWFQLPIQGERREEFTGAREHSYDFICDKDI